MDAKMTSGKLRAITNRKGVLACSRVVIRTADGQEVGR